MWHNDDPGTEHLRKDLRDYYGTAMFNGNPMAMMELEEVERASRSELNDIARRNGFDPNDYSTPLSSTYDSPYSSPGRSRGSGCSGAANYPLGTNDSANASVSVSISMHSETISENTRTFFEPNKQNSDTGFFANYAKRLKDQL